LAAGACGISRAWSLRNSLILELLLERCGAGLRAARLGRIIIDAADADRLELSQGPRLVALVDQRLGEEEPRAQGLRTGGHRLLEDLLAVIEAPLGPGKLVVVAPEGHLRADVIHRRHGVLGIGRRALLHWISELSLQPLEDCVHDPDALRIHSDVDTGPVLGRQALWIEGLRLLADIPAGLAQLLLAVRVVHLAVREPEVVVGDAPQLLVVVRLGEFPGHPAELARIHRAVANGPELVEVLDVGLVDLGRGSGRCSGVVHGRWHRRGRGPGRWVSSNCQGEPGRCDRNEVGHRA
jgi:hypothetical protein